MFIYPECVYLSMRQPSNKQRLQMLLKGSISNKLEDYYYISVDPDMDIDKDTGKFFVQRDGADYYKITFNLHYSTFNADAKNLPGVQARILFAMFNSISASRFDAYPSTTDVCINTFLGYSSRLNDIFNIAPKADKTSSKNLRITAYPLQNGFSQFVALLSDKEAVLTVHGQLPLDTLKGLFNPFFKPPSPVEPIDLAGLLATYISEDYAKCSKP